MGPIDLEELELFSTHLRGTLTLQLLEAGSWDGATTVLGRGLGWVSRGGSRVERAGWEQRVGDE